MLRLCNQFLRKEVNPLGRFSLKRLLGQPTPKAPQEKDLTKKAFIAGASADTVSVGAYDNSNVTYRSNLTDVSYDSLLRDKQKNINTLYMLSDYYTDADPIVHGINKHVYVPFSTGPWYLTCENVKTIEIYETYYKKIRLREFIDDVFLQLYKYSNVFVYILNGIPITLPPHKCTIANVAINGTPAVDYDVSSIRNEFKRMQSSVYNQSGIDDSTLEKILEGYPPEFAEAIRENKQYARLDPKNTFVIQGSKEGWQRYAIPWIASALPALAKKERIEAYENGSLNIGARPFVHVRYGDTSKDYDMLPDASQLGIVGSVFVKAMKGNPLAVTNHLAKAEIIQADLSNLYQYPLYSQVNSDILAAGGIAGIIVNGDSEEGSTFASAQVSMQAAASRIESSRQEFEDLMYKLNVRIAEDIKLTRTNNLKNIPEFHFKPLSMSGQKELRESCEKLWNLGLVSSETMLNAFGYTVHKEKTLREEELRNGTDDVLTQRFGVSQMTPKEAPDNGRPQMSDEERNSDPENSIRSKQAKDAADGETSV